MDVWPKIQEEENCSSLNFPHQRHTCKLVHSPMTSLKIFFDLSWFVLTKSYVVSEVVSGKKRMSILSCVLDDLLVRKFVLWIAEDEL